MGGVAVADVRHNRGVDSAGRGHRRDSRIRRELARDRCLAMAETRGPDHRRAARPRRKGRSAFIAGLSAAREPRRHAAARTGFLFLGPLPWAKAHVSPALTAETGARAVGRRVEWKMILVNRRIRPTEHGAKGPQAPRCNLLRIDPLRRSRQPVQHGSSSVAVGQADARDVDLAFLPRPCSGDARARLGCCAFRQAYDWRRPEASGPRPPVRPTVWYGRCD